MKKYLIILFLFFSMNIALAEQCSVDNLNDPTICDKAGLEALAVSLGAEKDQKTEVITERFTKSLKLGMRDVEVKYLQQFLNFDPETTVAVSGVGSSGKETVYFGKATQSAVRKFQIKYGINPVSGYWGIISRTKANELYIKNRVGECINGEDAVTGQPCSVSACTKENNCCSADNDCNYVWFTGGCNTNEYVARILKESVRSGKTIGEALVRDNVSCSCENSKCMTHN
ncbi:MAG: peptidoglycan-binding domain-containing protein [Candidatus Pacebacteria bacterium]|nr:peptidoglycan-binding domain-containing protein [Candidatus Paceibacterota bacterium]